MISPNRPATPNGGYSSSSRSQVGTERDVGAGLGRQAPYAHAEHDRQWAILMTVHTAYQPARTPGRRHVPAIAAGIARCPDWPGGVADRAGYSPHGWRQRGSGPAIERSRWPAKRLRLFRARLIEEHRADRERAAKQGTVTCSLKLLRRLAGVLAWDCEPPGPATSPSPARPVWHPVTGLAPMVSCRPAALRSVQEFAVGEGHSVVAPASFPPVRQPVTLTFSAWGPFWPWVMSNSTFCPSSRPRWPPPVIALKCTHTSGPPSTAMKP